MKLQNLTIIFIIIIIPVILLVSIYISVGTKTIKYQALYDNGLLSATHDAVNAFEQNTLNNDYSENPETKRSILNACVKMFEKSLCNSCNISSYNTEQIEEYIPAIVFGMYDGFYMYAPSLNTETNKYEHSLKNYVYYSEELEDGTIIKYSLDNYVVVSGKFDGKYETHEGYLTYFSWNKLYYSENNKKVYYNNKILDESDEYAMNYYSESKEFTDWFKKNINDYDYLTIGSDNDPEDENSSFVQHKRKVMKDKIEGVLNSSITAYAEKSKINYKMPKLSPYDWEKIYGNISVMAFFQGKSIGLTKYNGYCVLNSTNSNEYVNPNLMYFINNGEYHDIRCDKISDIGTYIKGYRIGSYEIKKAKDESEYTCDHNELACYNCINGSLSSTESIYKYVRESNNTYIKTSYFTSLARERYKSKRITIQKTMLQDFGLSQDNIGDYINYDCTKNSSGKIYTKDSNGNYFSYTSPTDKTGNTEDQIFAVKENPRWRILGVENGRILITTEGTTEETLSLDGTKGYVNGIEEMNNIGAMYGKGKYASYGRSIKIEDYSKKAFDMITISFTPFFYINKNNECKELQEGQTTQVVWTDLVADPQPNTKVSELIVESVNNDYWFATRGLTNNMVYAYYGAYVKVKLVRCANTLGLSWNMIADFDFCCTLNVRPVVALKSNVKLTKGSDNVWQISE